MNKFQHHTLKEYLTQLSRKVPVPGGGSAAALCGALGAALLSMVAQYSLGRNSSVAQEKKMQDALSQSERLRHRLTTLVDLDAQAYRRVVKSRGASLARRQRALKKAREVPLEICERCYQAANLAPFLVQSGNPSLLSDVEVAMELLWAAFRAAKINVEINQ